MFSFVPVLSAALALSAPMAAPANQQSTPAPAKTQAAYSVQETSLGTLLDDPVSREIVRRYAPTIINHPQVSMARPLTLSQLQRFAGDILNDDVLAKIDAALKAAAPA